MEMLNQSKTKTHRGKHQTHVQHLGLMVASSMPLSGPTLPALLLAAYMISFFGQLQCVLTAFLPKYIWSLHYNFASLPQPHIQTSQELCVENPTVLHVAWLNSFLVENLQHPFIFVSCMLSIAVLYE